MAKRQYRMTLREYQHLNKRAVPYLLFIAVVAFICTASLFLGNFWSIKVSYTLDAKEVSNLINQSQDPDTKDIDLSSLGSTTFNLSLSIKSIDLISSLTKGNNAAAQTLLKSATKELSEQVEELFEAVVALSIKMAVVLAADAVSEVITQEQSDVVIGAFDESAVNELIDMLFEETVSGQQIQDKIIDLISTQLEATDMTQEEKDEFLAVVTEDTEKVVDSIISQFGDENGNINKDIIAATLLSEMASSTGGQGASSGQIDDVVAHLMAQMPDKTVKTIKITMLVMGIILLAAAVSWALLLIAVVIKIDGKNKRVYMGNARFFGFLPFALFVILPSLVMLLAGSASDELAKELMNVTIRFSSITLISFIGAVVLMLVNWFGYGSIKRQIKNSIIID